MISWVAAGVSPHLAAAKLSPLPNPLPARRQQPARPRPVGRLPPPQAAPEAARLGEPSGSAPLQSACARHKVRGSRPPGFSALTSPQLPTEYDAIGGERACAEKFPQSNPSKRATLHFLGGPFLNKTTQVSFAE